MTIYVTVKQNETDKDLPLPSYATEQSAGMDLMASVTEDLVLKAGEKALVSTGISIALPDDYEAQIRPRSGLAAKHAITVLNAPGTIDADYRGEIKVILINLSKEDFTISRGMRIAQMVVAPVTQIKFNQVANLEIDTNRGAGGFGSTGTHN